MENSNHNATPEILITIMSTMHQMSPAMHKIAIYIMDNFELLDGIQIQQLAKNSGVSEATITRFVKEIGFSNFQSFVIQVAKANTRPSQPQFSYSSIQEDDDADTICKKIFSINLQTITDTWSVLNQNAIKEAAKAVRKGRRIMIFAQGRSVVTAESLCQRLKRLGIISGVYVDAHDGAIVSSMAGENDVIIGISTHGRSRMVVSAMERAQKNGAVTIAVTSYENTPLDGYADIILKTVSNENLALGFEPSCATVTQMIMLDCLYIVLYMQDKENADRFIENSIKAVNEEGM